MSTLWKAEERFIKTYFTKYPGIIHLDFVIDAACVGMEDSIKGHVPVGFVVVDKTVSISRDEAIKQVIKSVREFVGPITPTMENPHVLQDIEEIVREEKIMDRSLPH
ncbi:Acyl-CoA synthetase short-chain family member 3 [Acropora cervicornis]|uniref:Acyl-CoA synthetase short-chain family member 3 n=1 Tax=Acropora cervicornis TaxID=6130 RepID=A0AAD9VCH7_ACRCE|nr:Acyl-CoA synthetase short-chain family member 3 [Acropora cervicornis]